MTPAKLLALEEARRDVLSVQALAVDKLAWLYVNYHRYPGKVDEHGRVLEPPAPEVPLDEILTFRPRNKQRRVAAETHWDAAILGAYASKEAFSAWAGNALGQVFIPTKES